MWKVNLYRAKRDALSISEVAKGAFRLQIGWIGVGRIRKLGRFFRKRLDAARLHFLGLVVCRECFLIGGTALAKLAALALLQAAWTGRMLLPRQAAALVQGKQSFDVLAVRVIRESRAGEDALSQHARRDSNPQPMVPKTIALSS